MNHLTVVEGFNEENGRKKEALVYLAEDLIEEESKAQLQQVMRNGTVDEIRIMPDVHPGHGCLVGFTAKVEIDKIDPNLIGGDIGCGILTYPLGKKKINAIKIEEKVKRLIPMGNERSGNHEFIPFEESFLSRYLSKANNRLKEFYDAMKDRKPDCTLTSDLTPPTIDTVYLRRTCGKIDADYDSCMRSLGTLGGGNHFIEVNLDEATQESYLTIHSGSRGFGMKLFRFHSSLVNKTEKALTKEKALDYINDMVLAQELAIMNRHIMLQLILRELNVEFSIDSIIESVHNYIDFSRMVLRKGAISAENGELCLIALNMRDGIMMCSGLGNEDWNYSCAHGCGRLMMRGEARNHISLKTFQKSMKDVVSSSVSKETLDEAPQAYKDFGVIAESINNRSVRILKILKPIINWKG